MTLHITTIFFMSFNLRTITKTSLNRFVHVK